MNSSSKDTSPSKLSRRDVLVTASIGALTAAIAGPAWSVERALLKTKSPWDRANSLDGVIQEAVSSGDIVGTSVIAAKDGKVVYQRAAGFADREARRPMTKDEIFRLASMTKPIVCVTALALVDRGQLRLEDPVTRWLSNFRPKLADGREPVITVRHLLTHTAGLTYGFLEAPGGPYHRLGVSEGLDASGLTLEENLQRVALAPLLYEPGTSWHYSIAIDVLGAIIERVTGTTLAEAVRSIVTGPLGMSSVQFVAPAGALLATPYGDAVPQPVRMTDSFSLKFGQSEIAYSPSRAFDPNAFPSGGVGMVGTAGDYLSFAEAIRTGGAGIIRPETATAMTTNAMGELPTGAAGPGFGWGLGVAVLEDPAAAKSPLTAGAWSWSGVYGTNFWVESIEKLSFVVLTNTAVAGMTGNFPMALRRAVYAG